jgi:hypothetical protein
VIDLHGLRRLEPWFYRAPSAHNTQPWVLTYERDRLELGFDPTRHLRAGDPTRRDLLLSLGAFVETVLIAAAAEGIQLEFRTQPWRLVEGPDPYSTAFTLEHLARRQTSRLPYEAGRLPAELLASAREQLLPDQRLHELATSDVVDLFTTADRHFYESPAVVAELRSWLRLSKRDPRYTQDGLTYECLALSWVEARGLALLLRPGVYRLVRRLGVHRFFTASGRSVLEREGSVLVLEGAAEGHDELLLAGRSLLRTWLALTAAGYVTHPLSQILDCEETETELGRRLARAPGARLLSIFRAGRSEPAPRSHRLVPAG